VKEEERRSKNTLFMCMLLERVKEKNGEERTLVLRVPDNNITIARSAL